MESSVESSRPRLTRGRRVAAWLLSIAAALVGLDFLLGWTYGQSATHLGLIAELGTVFFALVAFALLAWRPSSTPIRDAVVAGALAASVCLSNGLALGSGDTASTRQLPYVLLREGRLNFGSARDTRTLPYWYVRRDDGVVFSRYPLATALLVTPFYVPRVLGTSSADDAVSVHLEDLSSALLAGIGTAFLMHALSRLVGARRAAWAIAAYVTGTAIMTVVGQGLFQHAGAVFCLSLGVWGLIVPRRSWTRGLVAGVAFAAVAACRPVDVVLSVAGFAALAMVDRRSVPIAVLAGLAVGVPVLIYNHDSFGTWISAGYGAEAGEGWTGPFPSSLVAMLVSPFRGIFLWSPILLFALPKLWRPEDGLLPARATRALALGAIAFTVLMSFWWAWHGAWSPGPRMLSDTLPIFAIGLAYAAPSGAGLRRRLFLAAAVWSLVVHASTAYAPRGSTFRALVWSGVEGPWSPRSFAPVAFVRAFTGPPVEAP